MKTRSGFRRLRCGKFMLPRRVNNRPKVRHQQGRAKEIQLIYAHFAPPGHFLRDRRPRIRLQAGQQIYQNQLKFTERRPPGTPFYRAKAGCQPNLAGGCRETNSILGAHKL